MRIWVLNFIQISLLIIISAACFAQNSGSAFILRDPFVIFKDSEIASQKKIVKELRSNGWEVEQYVRSDSDFMRHFEDENALGKPKPLTCEVFKDLVDSIVKRLDGPSPADGPYISAAEDKFYRKGDSILFVMTLHGVRPDQGEKFHQVRMNSGSGRETCSTEELSRIASHPRVRSGEVKLAVIEHSCFSGATLDLAKDGSTCVMASSGRNSYAYSDFFEFVSKSFESAANLTAVFRNTNSIAAKSGITNGTSVALLSSEQSCLEQYLGPIQKSLLDVAGRDHAINEPWCAIAPDLWSLLLGRIELPSAKQLKMVDAISKESDLYARYVKFLQIKNRVVEMLGEQKLLEKEYLKQVGLSEGSEVTFDTCAIASLEDLKKRSLETTRPKAHPKLLMGQKQLNDWERCHFARSPSIKNAKTLAMLDRRDKINSELKKITSLSDVPPYADWEAASRALKSEIIRAMPLLIEACAAERDEFRPHDSCVDFTLQGKTPRRSEGKN